MLGKIGQVRVQSNWDSNHGWMNINIMITSEVIVKKVNVMNIHRLSGKKLPILDAV
ncbi:unnamed protein product [Trichobilharzia szidati]|nr:unnamed protein product [Trichobilharzia szidati]